MHQASAGAQDFSPAYYARLRAWGLENHRLLAGQPLEPRYDADRWWWQHRDMTEDGWLPAPWDSSAVAVRVSRELTILQLASWAPRFRIEVPRSAWRGCPLTPRDLWKGRPLVRYIALRWRFDGTPLPFLLLKQYDLYGPRDRLWTSRDSWAHQSWGDIGRWGMDHLGWCPTESCFDTHLWSKGGITRKCYWTVGHDQAGGAAYAIEQARDIPGPGLEPWPFQPGILTSPDDGEHAGMCTEDLLEGDLVNYVVTKLGTPTRAPRPGSLGEDPENRLTYAPILTHPDHVDQLLRNQRRHEDDACFQAAPNQPGDSPPYPRHATYLVAERLGLCWSGGPIFVGDQLQLCVSTRVRLDVWNNPDQSPGCFANLPRGGEMRTTDEAGRPYDYAPRTVDQCLARLSWYDEWSGHAHRPCGRVAHGGCGRHHQPVGQDWGLGFFTSIVNMRKIFGNGTFCGANILPLKPPSRRTRGLRPLELSLQVLGLGVRQRSRVRISLRRKMLGENRRGNIKTTRKVTKRLLHEPWSLLADINSVRLAMPQGFGERTVNGRRVLSGPERQQVALTRRFGERTA
jgi:hypothetical protein